MEYNGLVEKTKTPPGAVALQNLEAEIGEELIYRASGRLVASAGLGDVPLGSWGLVVLTRTRLLFRHFSQAHPLFGGTDAELRFEVSRGRFTTCEARLQNFWAKLFSSTPDHVALVGPDALLNLELADALRKFPEVWNRPSP